MGRVSAFLVAFCMALIAAAAGIVSWLVFSFTGMEASVLGFAVMTALVLINSVSGRQRDRYYMGSQIADLSRATADIGRQRPAPPTAPTANVVRATPPDSRGGTQNWRPG